jgi:hypothetical protein
MHFLQKTQIIGAVVVIVVLFALRFTFDDGSRSGKGGKEDDLMDGVNCKLLGDVNGYSDPCSLAFWFLTHKVCLSSCYLS